MHPDPVSVEQLIAVVLIWCWIALPSIPIACAWVQLFRLSKSSTSVAKPLVLLLVTTISYSWILIELLFSGAIGPHYSSRRGTTICINLGVTGFLALLALIQQIWLGEISGPRERFGLLLFAASALTASLWIYIAVVSSAV